MQDVGMSGDRVYFDHSTIRTPHKINKLSLPRASTGL